IGTETPPGNCTVSHGFFFQAEDGIRDFHVTGVQTCALPIFSPAFGMIGTVIGLIKMLANLSDPDQIGSGLAVALITTFYGALLANLVFLPIANKLQAKTTQELLVRALVVEGILAIQAGDNPRIVEEKLQA